MELIDILENRLFNDVTIEPNLPLPEALKEHFYKTKILLQNLNPNNLLYQEILKRLPNDYTTIEYGIIETIELYFKGNLIDSLKTFDSLAEWLDKHYWYEKTVDLSEFPNIIHAIPRFYRCRIASKTSIQDIGSILHIPFQAREHAAHGRFNLAGMPCLYLGKSIHSCWEELNRPLFENIITAKFEIKKDINFNIINLSDPHILNYHHFEFIFFLGIYQVCKFLKDTEAIVSEELILIAESISSAVGITFKESPEEMAKSFEDPLKTKYLINEIIKKGGFTLERLLNIFYFNIEHEIYPHFEEDDWQLDKIKYFKSVFQTAIAKLVNDIIQHPIKIAASLKINNYNLSFKPEYVISQFLMHWLFKKNQTEETLYGISYLSSRAPILSLKKAQDINLYKNYAFPTIPAEKGYCSKILNSFEVSDIVSFQDITNSVNKDSFNKDGRIYTYSKIGIPYSETFLYELESLLEESRMHDLTKVFS